MRNLQVCPNCGRPAFGTRCKWCHHILASDKPVTSEEAEQPTVQVVENSEQSPWEPAAKAKPKPESLAKSTVMVVVDAQHRARRIISAAEQTARGLETQAKIEADTKSAEIISDAQQKASEILHKAEQAAAELTDKASG